MDGGAGRGWRRVKLRGGDEFWVIFLWAKAKVPGIKEAHHGRISMELTVTTAEARASDEAKLELAAEGGTHEALGLVWRETGEDLREQLVPRRWYRRRHGPWRKRGF